MSSLAYRSASELLRELSQGKQSSLELLEFLLARIERENGAINAVVASDPEGARARAREADAARARGESWGPLHGLPMTIKDSIEVVGMPTTSGAPELAGHFPKCNADTAQRLIDAGAIVFGKTNLPLYAGDFQSYNAVYGTTCNPWDLERGPGGSSGGSAAALAAGFSPLELGSDIGGSIRNPAHFCGVYGHKPSWGTVSGRGHIPGPPGAVSPSDLGVLGPLARTPEDLALAFDLLTGPSPSEATGWRLELPAARHERLADFRVALWLDQPGRPVSAEVADLIQQAADRIAQAGAHLDDRARPAIDPEDSHARYLRLLWSVMGAGFPLPVREALEKAHANLDPADRDWNAQMVRGAVGPHRAWLADNEARHHLRARWSEFFADVDVLLCPIMPTAAFPHDHAPIEQRMLDVDGHPMPYLEQLFWAGLITLVYLPASVVPVGRTRAGLPVGMQVVAPYLEDHTALHFARCIEDVVGGFVAPPRLDP